MFQESLTLLTQGRGFYVLTQRVQSIVQRSGVEAGMVNVFLHHSSASLIISENADPAVRRDLNAFMARLVPDGDKLFEHSAEGPDDMPAHVRSVLTCASISLPVLRGRCALGTWQGLYLWEHRRQEHQRQVTVSVWG
ncbi:MAG: secondary thiamine-phosphate synthase enzyme YjbQ [Myxococcota bacterium]|jgi:secondary thiamine-phosphate synthase enzyme|nr:secondary thiamine-phosphate synthase enzyme YjbQ [Myxococcota bacterium]